ncbi:MAG: diacylglycerol kinase family lipid kinase [Desulfitobacteriaceae bacterium]|nr:diacylglycerol kinase family lipid kinase [Desulfitobacteriaceae bacterium]MDD4346976.1 diacylglycerol kinase family lipid kinase [Desulfitobacteriaceae bacterium]MDD4401137.1 diacylglycerol kinase family lipid kinase [Desulfitobacteriaceae bacterium]
MKNKKMCLVYNPYAGRRKFTAQLDTVIRIFQESGHDVSIHRTSSPADVEQVAKQCCDVESLVIAGGDGSIHRIVNGLMKIPSNKRPVLGILPVGTANDLAYALHLPQRLVQACEVIARGRIFGMDVGMVNQRYFVNVACAGLLTDVSSKVDIRIKNTLGQLAYYLKGLETLPTYHPFRVKFVHDEVEFDEEILLLLVVNGFSVGGLRRLVPRASLSDGKLDVLIVRQTGWPDALRILLNALRGEQVDHERIDKFQIRDLTIYTDNVTCCDLDGEIGPDSPWHIQVNSKISVFY